MTIKTHSRNAAVVEQGLGAVRNLCVGCESNRRRFERCGGLEMLIGMLNTYASSAEVRRVDDVNGMEWK